MKCLIKKTFLLFTIFFSLLTLPGHTKNTNWQPSEKFKKDLEKIAAGSDGRVGICVMDIQSETSTCVNGEQKFSLQSVMKLMTAAAVMDFIDRKQLKLSDVVTLSPENGSPGPQEFFELIKRKGKLKTSIEDLLFRAVAESDSTSVDFLIDKLGGIATVQDFLERKQMGGIRIDRDERTLQSQTMGLTWKSEFSDPLKFEEAVKKLPDENRETAWSTYLKDPQDTATPVGMAHFLKALAQGKLLSPKSTRHLLKVMWKTKTGSQRLRAGTPKNWRLEHKTGTSPTWKEMSAAINDVGVLTAPNGKKFALAVFVAESKKTLAEKESIIAQTALLLTSSF